MATTPDRFSGPLIEEEIQFEDRTVDGHPDQEGHVRYLEGGLHLRDTFGSFNLRDSFIRKTLNYNLTVPSDVTWLTHDVEVADGVEILIEDTGEMLVL